MSIPKSEYISDIFKDGIFDNKVVFCTGGNGSICSAMVRAMVHLGANACIVGRNVPKTEDMAKSIATARKGAKVLGIGAIDVRNVESIKKAVEECASKLGAIDFVIAGAAGNFLAPLTGLSPNAFKSVIDIDLLGSYNTFKITAPYLVESARRNANPERNASTGGRIIFVTATLHYNGTPFQAHAMAAKAAIDALSSSVAIEFGPRGLTSNVIAPGPIGSTEGMARLAGNADLDAAARHSVPLSRYGKVKEIADAMVFLFGDAGNFVNGAVLVVDGGDWRIPNMMGLEAGQLYPDNVLAGVIPKTGQSSQAKSKL